MHRLLLGLRELKRRRVYHVGVVYAAAAFAAAEAADVFLPQLGLPDWTVAAVVVVAVAGFPVALILGWVFDITPAGVRRTSPESISRPRPGRWRVAGGSAFAMLVFTGAGWWLASSALRPPPIESLAVLPLHNLMDRSDQEYFVEGMHDALIAELSKIGGVRVTSRTSVLRYRQTDMSMPQIARELGVDGLIEGSVYGGSDQVRITVKLFHGPSDRHLWAESYQRSLRDVLVLQREVTRAIATQIEITLTPEQESRLARVRRVDPEAYTLYLKGNFQAIRRTYPDAIEYYRQAISADSTFAPVHAALALAYMERGLMFVDSPAEFRSTTSQARAAAARALELDSELAEAHIAMGRIRQLADWDWIGAEAAFQRGIDLSPSSTHALLTYHNYLIAMGRFEEAIDVSRTMIERDPLAAYPPTSLAFALLHLGRYAESLEHSAQSLKIAPDHFDPNLLRAELYTLLGQFDEALGFADQARPVPARHRFRLGYVYAKAGRRDEALRILSDMTAAVRADSASSMHLALLHLALDHEEEALALLEEGYERRDPVAVFLKGYYMFDPLRDEPRFQRLLERMNFPE